MFGTRSKCHCNPLTSDLLPCPRLMAQISPVPSIVTICCHCRCCCCLVARGRADMRAPVESSRGQTKWRKERIGQPRAHCSQNDRSPRRKKEPKPTDWPPPPPLFDTSASLGRAPPEITRGIWRLGPFFMFSLVSGLALSCWKQH